jgi:CDP-diacylglycerol--serine O-phosphatidyltransferase
MKNGARRVRRARMRRGIPLRALVPNAVTALALCFGLTGVRFAIAADWERAVACIIIAGVLDGIDGRIARLLKGESRFGAELDSLSDVIAFGVAPAIIVYLWCLQTLPQLGWVVALTHAVCCALRLARFNAAIDASDQPHKSAGYLTGVPAPAGAGLMLVPLYIWMWTGLDAFRQNIIVVPWTLFVAMLLISNVATFSWAALRPRHDVRLWLIGLAGLIGASLISAPWITLTAVSAAYVIAIPFGMRSYAKVRRQRGEMQAGSPPPSSSPSPR